MWGRWPSPEAGVRQGPRRPAALLAGLALAFIVLALLVAPTGAHAEGIPPEYKPMVLRPSGMPQAHEFDLTAPLERARKEGKRLYIFLGAHDCPYCRRYEAFLKAHATELVPHFSPYLVVDLRSELMVQPRTLRLRIGNRSWSYTEFQHDIGDERERLLVYPNVWLLDANARPLMQMPAGTGTFETVDEQLEILRLEN